MEFATQLQSLSTRLACHEVEDVFSMETLFRITDPGSSEPKPTSNRRTSPSPDASEGARLVGANEKKIAPRESTATQETMEYRTDIPPFQDSSHGLRPDSLFPCLD
jgi:hypothetical protein